jgi:hypothetical protein
MKHRKYSVKLFLCVLLVLGVFLTAVTCAKQSTPTTEITGTVEQTDQGVVIASEGGQYLVAGQDLSSKLGMKVKATGTVTEAEGRKTINVTSVTEVQ